MDVTPTPDDIAAAVQEHLKALRILGREAITVDQVAAALHLTGGEIECTMDSFKVVGARLTNVRRAQCSKMSRVITLKKMRSK